MSTYYFDSSAIVKYYVPESGSGWVAMIIEAKVDAMPVHTIVLAEIGEVEVAAAFAKRQRMREISVKMQRTALANFLHGCQKRFQIVELDSALV